MKSILAKWFWTKTAPAVSPVLETAGIAEPMIINPVKIEQSFRKLVNSLKFERDMVDLLAFWIENELPSILERALANSTYHYTMFDGVEQIHGWVRVPSLRKQMAKVLWDNGFAFSGGTGDYLRCVVTVRSPGDTARTWEEYVKIHKDFE